MTMKAKIYVTLKAGVLDPQGKAINNSLHHLGFDQVADVRQGKFIEVEIKEADEDKAKKYIDEMCKKLLVNTVIENYTFTISN